MGTVRHAAMLAVLLVARAHAETDIELADKLFAEGLALRETNLQQSCDKFALSLRKNPQAIGTLLNVALCDEKLGRIASAHERFSEARDRAKEGNLPEYLAEAQSHIDKLAPELPYVTIKFLAGKPAGTRVLIGDRVVPNDKLETGDKVAVDPGELVIVVSAPNRLAYETKMMIDRKATRSIEIPELKRGVTVKRGGNTRRTIGIIGTAGGGAMILASQILGYYAYTRYDGQFDNPSTGCKVEEMGGAVCHPEAQGKITSAQTLANVGTGVGVLGLAVTGVGLYLWLSAPSEKPERPRQLTIVPTLSPESAGLGALGRF